MSQDPYGSEFDDGPSLTASFPQLRDPIGVLRRGWKWGVVAAVIVGAVALTLAQMVPLKYEASGSLLMAEKRIPDRYVPSTIKGQMGEQLEKIKGEITTRRVLSEIIRESGLYADEHETTSMNALTARLRQELQIEYRAADRATSTIVRVALQGEEPEVVAAAVNEVSARLIDANVAYRSEQARLTSAFMRREFERADAALRAHQRKLAEFRDEHRGSLPEQQEATIARLERLELQRRSLILQINELRNRISIAEAKGSLVVDDEGGTLAALREQLIQAKSLYTDEHPTLISLRRRIRDLEAAGGASGSDTVGAARRSGSRRELDLASMRLSEIDAEVLRLEALVEKTSDITEEYRAMSREEEILNENYTEYLRKLKDSELSQSLENSQQGARLSRIEAAIPPRAPVMPRWQFNAVAIVLALAAGIGLGVLRDFLFPVVIDDADLAHLTGAPTLGTIPKAA